MNTSRHSLCTPFSNIPGIVKWSVVKQMYILQNGYEGIGHSNKICLFRLGGTQISYQVIQT